MNTLAMVLMLLTGSAAAAAFVVIPLWRGRASGSINPAKADLNARHARLREMEEEWRAGLLGDDEYSEVRLEAERDLLASTGDGGLLEREGTDNTAVPSRRAAAIWGAMVLALAVGSYIGTGRLDLVVGGSDPKQGADMAFDPTQISEGLSDLEAHVAARPADIQAWTMLGSAYLALDRSEDAVQAMARAVEANGDAPDLLIIWARALASDQGGRFTGEPAQLIERALARAPAHPNALFFGGLAAAHAEDWERTRSRWERLRAQLPDGDALAARIDRTLSEIPGD